MKSIVIDSADPNAFRAQLEHTLTETMKGFILMSVLYSTRTQDGVPWFSALVLYRPQE